MKQLNPTKEYTTIEEIINGLGKDNPADSMVWVGKSYSKADLRRDLRRLIDSK